jgi:hypothetical protein
VVSQLLAAEQVVTELRDAFRGEDPLYPLARRMLGRC